MKINFDKSEVFTMGLSEEEQQETVRVLNCKLGSEILRYACQ
jgi:hypothetical protein